MTRSIPIVFLSGALFLAATSVSQIAYAQQAGDGLGCDPAYDGWLCPWAEIGGGQGDGGDGQGGGQGGNGAQGGGPQGGGPQGGGPQGGGPQGSGGED